MEIKIEQTIKEIINFLYDKKAMDIKAFNVTNLTPLWDYIIISSTSNTTHVKSLTEDLKDFLGDDLIKNIEKDDNFNWVVIDCGLFIIHIFHQTTREFYNLESLWSDATQMNFD